MMNVEAAVNAYFPVLRAEDWIAVLCANGFNLLCLLMFWLRAQHKAALGSRFGWAAVALAVPLAGVAVVNALHQRGVWWSMLLLPVLLYALVEWVLDGLLKLNFRETRWLGLYLLLYYLAQFGLIGYAFLTGKGYGLVTLATYFAALGMTAYSYRRVGHG